MPPTALTADLLSAWADHLVLFAADLDLQLAALQNLGSALPSHGLPEDEELRRCRAVGSSCVHWVVAVLNLHGAANASVATASTLLLRRVCWAAEDKSPLVPIVTSCVLGALSAHRGVYAVVSHTLVCLYNLALAPEVGEVAAAVPLLLDWSTDFPWDADLAESVLGFVRNIIQDAGRAGFQDVDACEGVVERLLGMFPNEWEVAEAALGVYSNAAIPRANRERLRQVVPAALRIVRRFSDVQSVVDVGLSFLSNAAYESHGAGELLMTTLPDAVAALECHGHALSVARISVRLLRFTMEWGEVAAPRLAACVPSVLAAMTLHVEDLDAVVDSLQLLASLATAAPGHDALHGVGPVVVRVMKASPWMDYVIERGMSILQALAPCMDDGLEELIGEVHAMVQPQAAGDAVGVPHPDLGFLALEALLERQNVLERRWSPLRSGWCEAVAHANYLRSSGSVPIRLLGTL